MVVMCGFYVTIILFWYLVLVYDFCTTICEANLVLVYDFCTTICEANLVLVCDLQVVIVFNLLVNFVSK
jgi:hypothetical protein